MITTTTLRYQPVGDVRLDFDDLNVNAGVGAHRLVLPMTHSASWLAADSAADPTPALVLGSAWVDTPGIRWLAALEPSVLDLRATPTTADLTIPAPDDQLIALERARGEGDLTIHLKLQMTLLQPADGVYPLRHDEITLRVRRTRWLELLDQLGTEVGILVRIPSPLTTAASDEAPIDGAIELSRTVAHLRQARAELAEHRWKHAVATCREVLDHLGALASPPTEASFRTIPAKQRTQDQRWAAIFHDVRSMTNAAHHPDGATADITWTRSDAEAVLAATAALLAHYTTDY